MEAKKHFAPTAKEQLPGDSKHPFRRILCAGAFFVMILLASYAHAAEQTIVDDLFGVNFISAKEGWVSGRAGAIYHTADGGVTWQLQKTNTDITLGSVFFLDANNGWAVGDASTILHTRDGGKTWVKQNCPVPFFYLMDVHFVSPTRGWIVTEKTHILATDNGGETWSVQFQDQDFILKSLSFSDPLNGWAVGEYGYTYHTVDGGAHWKHESGFYGIDEMTGEIKGANYLFGVTAVNAKKAWAVGIDGTVVKTDDGGKSWKAIPNPAGRAMFTSVATDGAAAVVIAGKDGLLISADDGKTWSKPSFQPALGYQWLYRVGRIPNVGFAVVGAQGSIYLSNRNGSVYMGHQKNK